MNEGRDDEVLEYTVPLCAVMVVGLEEIDVAADDEDNVMEV